MSTLLAYSGLFLLDGALRQFWLSKSSTVVLWIPLRTAEVHFSMISGDYSRLARASVENGNSIERWRQTDCKEMSESNQSMPDTLPVCPHADAETPSSLKLSEKTPTTSSLLRVFLDMCGL
jgi:hypothetical protein